MSARENQLMHFNSMVLKTRTMLHSSLPVFSIIMLGLALPVFSQQTGPANISIKLIGGGSYFEIEQAMPNYPPSRDAFPSMNPPLLIMGVITNEGDKDFVGVFSKSYTDNDLESYLVFSEKGVDDTGSKIYIGDYSLNSSPALAPAVNGFVLRPRETQTFVLHIIYGMTCKGCQDPSTDPVYKPAECGENFYLENSQLEIRQGKVNDNGKIVVDTSIPPEVTKEVFGPFPIQIQVLKTAKFHSQY